MMKRPLSLGFLTFMSWSLLAGVLLGQSIQDEMAVSYLDSGLRFDVRVPNGGSTLTVTGAKSYVHEQVFSRNDDFVYSIHDGDGGSVEDGIYAFELRLSPLIDEEVLRRLANARQAGDESVAMRLRAEGQIPETVPVFSGSFTVLDGWVRQPQGEEAPSVLTSRVVAEASPVASAPLPGNVTMAPLADTVVDEDLIVSARACVSGACSEGETFHHAYPLKVHANATGIQFEDSSTSPFFPSNDWAITANDYSVGMDRFSIDDLTHSTKPFSIQAAAPTSSLYVSAQGLVGNGTSTPLAEFHTVSPNSPTLRLEQDGSAGWARQTWDLAGNEGSFTVRNVSAGTLPLTVSSSAPTNSLYVDRQGFVGNGTSTPLAEFHTVSPNSPTLRLEQDGSAGWAPHTWDIVGSEVNFAVQDETGFRPFVILPDAPTNSLVIGPSGAIGHGVASPTSTLDFRGTAGDLHARLQEDSSEVATRTLLTLSNNGGVAVDLNGEWKMTALTSGTLEFRTPLRFGGIQFLPRGDISIPGDFIARGTTLKVPDYVFAEDYPLMPLEELEAFILEEGHLPKIPNAETVRAQGLNVSQVQMGLLEKIEELTLYILQQQRVLDELQRAHAHE